MAASVQTSEIFYSKLQVIIHANVHMQTQLSALGKSLVPRWLHYRVCLNTNNLADLCWQQKNGISCQRLMGFSQIDLKWFQLVWPQSRVTSNINLKKTNIIRVQIHATFQFLQSLSIESNLLFWKFNSSLTDPWLDLDNYRRVAV